MIGTMTSIENIPKGHSNAVYVSNDNCEFRRLVRQANLSGEDVIINVGSGYFRVDKDDPIDMRMFNEYIERERGRARKMWIKANVMANTLRKEN